MEFTSGGMTKAVYASTLAATLACFLQLQGDAVGLLTLDEELRDFIPARFRTGHLRQLMLALERAPAGRKTDLGTALERLADLVPRRGLVVVVSDFLVPVEDLMPRLRRLTACAHEVVLFQVLDPAEITFGFDQPTRFRDLETGQLMEVDPAAARAGYQSRFDAHQARLRDGCVGLGIAFHRVETSQPLELALMAFLEQRERRGGGRSPQAGPAADESGEAAG
jgi:hypothetical protein